MPTRQRLLEMMQGFDDRVQQDIRGGYGFLAERMPGDMGNTVNGFARVIHPYRNEVDNTWQGQSALYGTRALQAGGLTAAGIGLANLATAIGNQFGGPADGRQPDTLPM